MSSWRCAPNPNLLDLAGLDASIRGLIVVALGLLGLIGSGVLLHLRWRRSLAGRPPAWATVHGLGATLAILVGMGLFFTGECAPTPLRERADRFALRVAGVTVGLWVGGAALAALRTRKG